MQSAIISVPLGGALLLGHALALLALLLASGLGLFGVLASLGSRKKEEYPVLLGVSLVCGPMLMAWFLTIALTLMPGRPPALYLSVCSIVAGAAALYSIARYRQPFQQLLIAYASGLLKHPFAALAVLIVLTTLVWMLITFGVTTFYLSVYSNDALEYLTAARVSYERADLSGHPFIDRNITGGFVGVWTHPPAYVSLLTLAYFVQGSAAYAGAAKFVSAYFLFAQTVLLLVFTDPGRRIAGPLAALICVATPVYFLLSFQGHIDSMRIAAFSAAMIATWRLSQGPNFERILTAGIAIGMSHFSHSLGILTLCFAVPLFVISARSNNLRSIGAMLVSALIGVTLWLPFGLRNVEVFGSFAQDSSPVWQIKKLLVAETLAIERGIATPMDKISNGILRSFTQPEYLGLSAWALTIVLIVVVLRIGASEAWKRCWSGSFRQSALGVSLIVLVGFYAFLGLSVLMGLDIAIKNFRYVMTPQPFIATALAHLLVAAADSKAGQNNARS